MVRGLRIKAIHPGHVLRVEFLRPHNMSVASLARELGVSRSVIDDFVHGRRSVDVKLALALSQYWGTSANFWVNLQYKYDLEMMGNE